MIAVVCFTVACLVVKPLIRSVAKGDLVIIQTLLFFKCKSLCYHANYILVLITTRSSSASLQIKGLATKYTTIKWSIGQLQKFLSTSDNSCLEFIHSTIVGHKGTEWLAAEGEMKTTVPANGRNILATACKFIWASKTLAEILDKIAAAIAHFVHNGVQIV